MRLRELTDEQAYEAELAQCVGSTGFHRWFFLTAFADAVGLRLRAFAVDSSTGTLGVVPMLLRGRGPVTTVNYVAASRIGPVFHGDVLREGRVGEVLAAVEPVLRAERAVVTRWAFSEGRHLGADLLAVRGFDVWYEESFLVPGTLSADDYLKGLSPKQRAAIRRGGARGLTVGPSTAAEIVRWFPRQASKPVGRQGVREGRGADYTHASALRLAGRLGCDPRMYWRSVRDPGGATIAMNVSVIDSGRLWGWLLVGDPVPGPSPHVAAYWDAVQWSLARDLGCDFGPVPHQGIRDFKVAMGGIPESYAVAERIKPRAYRAGREFYDRIAGRRAAANDLVSKDSPIIAAPAPLIA